MFISDDREYRIFNVVAFFTLNLPIECRLVNFFFKTVLV